MLLAQQGPTYRLQTVAVLAVDTIASLAAPLLQLASPAMLLLILEYLMVLAVSP